MKQRIIDADITNSSGLVELEELSYNALAVYWKPLESPAKVNIAVQCRSTDFRWLTSLKPLSVDLNCLFQYRKRSIRSPTSHTNRHVWRSSVWCWPAALSPGLLSSQNILRQRSWEEAEGRGEKGSETSYDAQWEPKTGRDLPWILWKVSLILGRAWIWNDRERDSNKIDCLKCFFFFFDNIFHWDNVPFNKENLLKYRDVAVLIHSLFSI